MTRTFVIGDIHGCYDELMNLLDVAGVTDGDHLVAVGDIVDRGHESARVLAFFQTRLNARTILGNHERKHMRSCDGETEAALSQIITRQQIGEENYRAALDYMRRLPNYIELDSALIVHGFWQAGVPLAEQRDDVLNGMLTGEAIVQAQGDGPWYTRCDSDKPLIIGHRRYNGAMPFVWNERVYGLDTGCVYGGALTGLWLPEFRFVTVPSRGDHWAAVQAAHLPLTNSGPDCSP
jgi:serine/threonine protein phosphatase 1